MTEPSHHSSQRPIQPSDVPPAVDSGLLLPMKAYIGGGLHAEFDANATVVVRLGQYRHTELAFDKFTMRQLIDFYALGQQVLILRKQSASVPEPDQPEKPWAGVYPGMCINPAECKGKTHCPRRMSCCE